MVPHPRAEVGAHRLRAVNPPRPIAVVADRAGVPRAVVLRGRRLEVEAVQEEWRLVDEWWRERPIRRRYFRLALVDGRIVTVFHDGVDGAWYAQQPG